MFPMKNCGFSNVYNQEKRKILRVTGVNTVFDNSYKIESPADVKGKFSFIMNFLIHNSGFLKVSGGTKKENVPYKNPK